MKILTNVRLTIVWLTAACMLAGCHSSRKTVSERLPEREKESYQVRFDRSINEEKEWTVFSVPVNLSVSRPTEISFSGRAYFVKDKSVYLSLRKFGFEVAQISITPDSIVAVDKFNKKYVAESVTSLSAQTGMSVGDIQRLFLGEPFLPGEKPVSDRFVFEGAPGGGSWLAVPSKQSRYADLGFVFSDSDDSLTACAIGNASTTFTMEYDGRVSTDGGSLPSVDLLALVSPDFSAAVTFKWSWNQAKWGSESDINKFRKPTSSYKRIDAASLLKALAPK